MKPSAKLKAKRGIAIRPIIRKGKKSSNRKRPIWSISMQAIATIWRTAELIIIIIIIKNEKIFSYLFISTLDT